MTPSVEEKTQEHREDWSEFSDVPPQEYRSSIIFGRGSEYLNANVETLNPNRTRVLITLPPWLWDEIEWDKIEHHDYGTYGELLLGPTAPEDASYTERDACEKHQLRISARRESAVNDDEAEWFRNDLEGDVTDAFGYLDALLGGNEVDKEALGKALKRIEEQVRELRAWAYEHHGIGGA